VTQLARPDLNALLRDVDSFAARAIALGLQHGHLPADFGDALLAFLRARSLAFAQARRTGIALGRDLLDRGVRRAFTCLDLGLEQAADGDVEAALQNLTLDQLGPLSSSGHELACSRLARMRDESRQLSSVEQLSLFPELRGRLQSWSRLVPDTWSIPHADREPEEVDPRRHYTEFLLAAGRARVLAALPAAQLAPLHGQLFLTFGDILRRLAAAAALGLAHLTPGEAEAHQLRRQCCGNARLLPEARRQIVETLTRFLGWHVHCATARRALLAEIEVELDAIEAASADDGDLLMCLRPDLALAEAEEAALADAIEP